MAQLKIHTWPDDVLSQKAKPVERVTPELAQLASNMLETMYAAPGIGLAAPQVGQSVRLVVIDSRLRDDDGQVILDNMTDLEKQVKFPLRLFNPEIHMREGKTTFEEGCLSVPGFVEDVERAKYIEMTAMDVDGKKIEIKTDGLLAICIQHELDHLDGKLFIDRISTVKRTLIKNKIKKNGYPGSETYKQHIL